jgi:ribosomal protein L37AE/L43A
VSDQPFQCPECAAFWLKPVADGRWVCAACGVEIEESRMFTIAEGKAAVHEHE